MMDDAGDASAIGLAVHVIGIISAAASLQMTFDTFKTSLKKVRCWLFFVSNPCLQ
jgi:hypothetical protein